MEQDHLEEEPRYDLPDTLDRLNTEHQRIMENYGQTSSRRPPSPPADNASGCSDDYYRPMPELERVTLQL